MAFVIAVVAATVTIVRQLTDRRGILQTANPAGRRGLIIGVKTMNPDNLKSMSVDELWSLHELVVSVLTRKISSEQAGLERRLRALGKNTAFGI